MNSTPEGQSGNNKYLSAQSTLRIFTASIVLGVLSGCFSSDSSNGKTHLETLQKEEEGLSELSQIHQEAQKFAKLVKNIESKFGIKVIIGEPGTTLYALGMIERGDDKKRNSEPFMNVVTSFDLSRWRRIVEIVHALEDSFSLYDTDFISVIKTAYIADTIDNASGFAKVHPVPVGINGGNRSITIPSDPRYGDMNNIRRITHHEVTHVVALARSEPWPFTSPNNQAWASLKTGHPHGFMNNYGQKNSHEDVATVGEGLMFHLVQQGGKYSIPERIKTDDILARKIMFLTGSFYSKEEGKFTSDFTLQEFQKFFNLPDLRELPFYSRARSSDRFNYKFWNKTLDLATDKNNR